jgi:hypothetical protein
VAAMIKDLANNFETAEYDIKCFSFRHPVALPLSAAASHTLSVGIAASRPRIWEYCTRQVAMPEAFPQSEPERLVDFARPAFYFGPKIK